MTVKKPKNTEKMLIEGEPIVHTETVMMPYRMSRPRPPRPIIPAVFFNSTYFDSFFQNCNYCVTKHFNLEPWDLTLGFYDKGFCSCSLKRLVNRLYGRPEFRGINTMLDCRHRYP